jgi:hypothetical protein
VKLVRAAHALVHGVSQAQLSFLTGLDARRTDERPGRSAALDQFNLRLAEDLQRLSADVA